MQLDWHRDKGNVNVGRLVFNLGGGGVVNLKCVGEDLCFNRFKRFMLQTFHTLLWAPLWRVHRPV
ncbi:hypothetical protein HaLaN_32849 [Haematococcus lacustris]|uniref:Uncharacterized protein n=1 Tax=Haematococcus lacustris TaxID=44745 RepID=A0A6A0AKL8_HAELA|nr:hypothetical protein HaLaN_32849 [Haematococcus lacustris]